MLHVVRLLQVEETLHGKRVASLGFGSRRRWVRGGAGKGCGGRHRERQREEKRRGGEHGGRVMREDREASRAQSSPGKSGLYSESSGEFSQISRKTKSRSNAGSRRVTPPGCTGGIGRWDVDRSGGRAWDVHEGTLVFYSPGAQG